MRFVGGAAAAALSLLLLTGCGSQATQSMRTPSVTVAPTIATPTPTMTPTPSPTAASTADPGQDPEPAPTPAGLDPNRPKGQCPDDAIGVAVAPDADGGAAGSRYSTVFFTNTGGETCVLRGAPGVSVVGEGDGTQLGRPADRLQTGVRTVTLADGATAVATLRITNIAPDGGPLDGCTVVRGGGYRVYPPHSKRAFFVEDPEAVACSPGPEFMTVGPVALQRP
ncbi:DUF4232 domain-containing protein [uncultured Amnibacterium sp.]|uniref:DUF4232 domain-containing protein n=1 Tax=uncultured Amnibacterium sp. TaxID=1631851 RepID=UPI0035C98C6C